MDKFWKEAKSYVVKNKHFRKPTKGLIVDVIQYRLQGFCLDSIATFFGLGKSRIFKLESDFKKHLGKQAKEYDKAVDDAIKSRKIIIRK